VRILHVYKDYPPILGGIENHMRLLAEGQAARGHEVTVLVTNPDGARTTSAVENRVRVIRAARLASVASTPLSPALASELRRQSSDVTHLHFPYPVGEVSQWLLGRGRPTVMTYHSDVVRQAGILKLYRPALNRVLDAMDAIIIGSPPMRASSYLAGVQDRLRLVPYGIPVEHFMAPPEPSAQARVAQAVGPGGPILLFVGRLRYYKGLDYLLRAIPSIPDARLVVAGIGPMGAEWQALANQLGIAGRVNWLGETSDADLPALYQRADLFVLPASHTSEAFGLVQVEAMSAGLPVVCTELGTGTTYVNLDGVTGLVVPPRDSEALAASIRRLLADPALRASLGQAARSRARDQFGLDRMQERVLEVYREAASSH
jgi:rhamnosyl/mannosyltransferase